MSSFARPFSILIIDDNPEIGATVASVISKAFPEARHSFFSSAHEVEAYLASEHGTAPENRPKLILLDLNIPTPAEGWNLLSKLHKHGDWRLSPVIMLTSPTDDPDMLYNYAQGVASFIVKPEKAAAWKEFLSAIRNYWYKAVRIV